ncbi:hypothetical protein VRK_28580 [Vibrio sp. MEBiC08052]|nr:hypothetical protein VRK_28580 [Vibrio sp. MEBiC08052]
MLPTIVFPVHTGMNRKIQLDHLCVTGVPRTYGDEPFLKER